MATVTGFTAERMLNIENSTVVDGEVQGDNLILQTRDGTPIDAGNVRGPKGDTGAIGQPVSPGIISMYGGNSAPAGYLLCDGRLVSRVTYAALFAEIGVIWGAGDGLNTFGLPDLQQRFPAGKGTAAWANALTKADGSKDAALIQHQHDIGIPTTLRITDTDLTMGILLLVITPVAIIRTRCRTTCTLVLVIQEALLMASETLRRQVRAMVGISLTQRLLLT